MPKAVNADTLPRIVIHLGGWLVWIVSLAPCPGDGDEQENASHKKERGGNEVGPLPSHGAGGRAADTGKQNALQHAHRCRARSKRRRFENTTGAPQQKQRNDNPRRPAHRGGNDQRQQVSYCLNHSRATWLLIVIYEIAFCHQARSGRNDAAAWPTTSVSNRYTSPAAGSARRCSSLQFSVAVVT
jgi:hypothetical protein